MKTINFNNITDLRIERQRLEVKLGFLEEDIRANFKELKESLKPRNIIKSAFHSDSTQPDGDSISVTSSKVGATLVDLLVSGLFMRKSNIFKRLITSFVIQKAGPSVVEKAAPFVIKAVSDLYSKFTEKKHKSAFYDRTTVYDPE